MDTETAFSDRLTVKRTGVCGEQSGFCLLACFHFVYCIGNTI